MKFQVPPPVITPPTLNSQRGTLKLQALSGTETAAPEGPALGFLLSPEVRTPGPPQVAFGAPHPTQNPQILSCVPRVQGSPPPTPQLPEAAGGGDGGCARGPGDPRNPAVWKPPLPGCGPAPRWSCSRRRRSALGALRNDRRFRSTRDAPSPLFLCT